MKTILFSGFNLVENVLGITQQQVVKNVFLFFVYFHPKLCVAPIRESESA